MDDLPLKRRYARIERERRFLLERLPEQVDVHRYVRFHDRFIEGTFLRLRRVEGPDGAERVTKLGQKIVDPECPEDPRRRWMTTIYLGPGEAAALQALRGPTAVKRRHTLREQGHTWSIDVWEAPASAAGTILAEVECDTDEELAAIRIPTWALREVTDDPEYRSVVLARR